MPNQFRIDVLSQIATSLWSNWTIQIAFGAKNSDAKYVSEKLCVHKIPALEVKCIECTVLGDAPCHHLRSCVT